MIHISITLLIYKWYYGTFVVAVVVFVRICILIFIQKFSEWFFLRRSYYKYTPSNTSLDIIAYNTQNIVSDLAYYAVFRVGEN